VIKITKPALAIAILSASMAVPTFAHEEALEQGWCQGGNISILGTFQLYEKSLTYFQQETQVCTELKSCGQFDDDFGTARHAASGLCSTLAEAEKKFTNNGDDGTVRPIFDAPTTIKDSDSNHHLLYSIDQGVTFSCGLCTMPKPVVIKYK